MDEDALLDERTQRIFQSKDPLFCIKELNRVAKTLLRPLIQIQSRMTRERLPESEHKHTEIYTWPANRKKAESHKSPTHAAAGYVGGMATRCRRRIYVKLTCHLDEQGLRPLLWINHEWPDSLVFYRVYAYLSEHIVGMSRDYSIPLNVYPQSLGEGFLDGLEAKPGVDVTSISQSYRVGLSGELIKYPIDLEKSFFSLARQLDFLFVLFWPTISVLHDLDRKVWDAPGSDDDFATLLHHVDTTLEKLDPMLDSYLERLQFDLAASLTILENESSGVKFRHRAMNALEGSSKASIRTHRTRDRSLRTAKLEEALSTNNGRLICQVAGCGFDFVEKYGTLGTGFAHVHHNEPLAACDGPRVVALEDLTIVCPNCHAMIHRWMLKNPTSKPNLDSLVLVNR